ncbi:potassium transporter peripheral membrane component [Pseudovibrio sp. FO-BEG1]|uniref:Trk system potassium uptake protein TrkA n=1 Tax=Pseudovibrio denitrificans TaxID=258256 RepID=A0A1I6X9Q1_9HYPH|nr:MULTISPECIES: Trk system potassium transporter TrkA [Pseudovibrio]AEV37781.1 potassium transporter peripheral membrane component [Pseudovibrio sp. FO-BEG1]EEA96710.1 TrkA-N [Pseudovibrio sp. JE062]SFT34997.1 trk system potassium uptake protein TrkA [Pseudovibrio denitrificans]
MKVVICGAGQVGYGIAEKLAAEQNDVSVIDTSPQLVHAIRDTLDVRGFIGHGAHPDVLAQAGADQADMIIAVTLYDEINMVACQVAHSLFNVPIKVSRVRAQSYLQSHYRNLFSRDNMPIDVIISPEIEVGEMILRRLSLPGAMETVRFADDNMIIVGIDCGGDCPVLDTPLRQLTELFPDLSAVVVGIARDGKVFVPHSSDMMREGDLVYVCCERGQVRRTLSIFGHEEPEAKRVLIAGGGNIGAYVARRLEGKQSRTKVKIIEHSRDRAIRIADELRRTVVLHGSALDQVMLQEADVEDSDMMVALTNEDEVNILSCVMAKKMGCERNLSLLNNTSYPAFAHALGIDAFVNPRQVTISKILQHVRRGRIRAVHALQNGAAEVIEAEALDTSPLVGRPLREVELAEGIRIGGILRDGKVITPCGDERIQAHDRVVIFAVADKVRQVEQMFRVSLEFF